MSIATELQRLNNNLLDTYTAIVNKGGTAPANKNTANIKTAVGSIPMGIFQTSTATTGSNINVYHTGFCPFSQENASRDFDFSFTINAISVDPAYNVQQATLLGGNYEGGSPYPGIYIRVSQSETGRRVVTLNFKVCAFGDGGSSANFGGSSLTFPLKIKFTRRSGTLAVYINDNTTPLTSSAPGAAQVIYFDNEIILGAAYTSAMADGTYQRPFRSFSFSNLEFGYLD